MKIAVITDAHANLPALQAALRAINTEGCDAIFHVGDAVAIGPQPAECIDLFKKTPNLKCVFGNHEGYYLQGLPDTQPAWLSDGEFQHQLWTHEQLGEERKSILSTWPVVLEEQFEGVKAVFVHYGFTSSGKDFKLVVRNPDVTDLDSMFAGYHAEIVFFGHDHSPSDITGKARYINPGSLGCCPDAFARYVTAEFAKGRVEILHHSVAYDDSALYAAFEERAVPQREFIYKVFFGGRFEV